MPYPKKPTQIKKLEGTYRKDRAPDNEMIPEPYRGVPKPPVQVSKIKGARMLWRDKCRELNDLSMLSSIDFEQLAVYCLKMDEAFRMQDIIDREGVSFTTESGMVRQRPEVNIAKESFNLALKIATQFGFTPASRSRINVPDKKEDNPFKEFIDD